MEDVGNGELQLICDVVGVRIVTVEDFGRRKLRTKFVHDELLQIPGFERLTCWS